MDIIVVNDTNIFIDLMSVDLLDDFFRLPIEIHTTDFVLNELTDESQHNAIQKHKSFRPMQELNALNCSIKSTTDSLHGKLNAASESGAFHK